jgi:hypothetical protein
MNLAMFVAGELECIAIANEVEAVHRMRMLKEMMYQSSCYEFNVILNAHAAWLKECETGSDTWGDNFRDVTDPIFRRAPISTKGRRQIDKGSSFRKEEEKTGTYFCNAFQKGKCKLDSPHDGKVRGATVKVAHICAECFLKGKGEFKHPECSSACPFFNTAE